MANEGQRGDGSSPMMRIAAVVAFYFVVSISLVLLNKVLLSDESAAIPAPLFVTWFQCVVTVGICWALGELGRRAPAGSFLAGFPPYRFDPAVAQKVLPLSIIFVAMCAFNNLSLYYVEASFYTTARSLTILFNVVLSFVMLGEKPTLPVLGCLAVVVAGFYVGSKGEVNFSLIGTAFGVASSLFVALNGVRTKTGLTAVGGNQWKLCAANNFNACILFLPAILLSGELRVLAEHTALLFSPGYWGLMLVGGVAGFLIGIATILQIQATSPLTHNVSGTAKAAVQTVLALLIWRNPTTPAAMLGLALVLGGSLAYSVVRLRDMEAAKAAASAAAAAAKAAAVTTPADSKIASDAGVSGGGGGSAGSSVDVEAGSSPDAENAPLVGGSGSCPERALHRHARI